MKTSPQKPLTVAALLVAACLVGLMLVHAQETATQVQTAQPDSIVQITAEAQGLAQVSPADLPRSGTFWVILPGYGGNVTALPYPCMPGAPAGLPVYDITGNIFLVDDTGGQVLAGGSSTGAQASRAMIASALESQASTVVNLIAWIQGAAASQQMQAMDMPVPGGSGGTNGDGGFYSDSFQPQVFTTNDLWLQVVGTTNASTPAGTAYLVINMPWNVTNGVYDVFATTNLAPSAWQWVMRTAAGQTNLTVTGLPGPNEFFILGTMQLASDGSGLTVAYEQLVGTTLPNDGYGTPNAWYLQNNLTPFEATQDPDQDGLLNWQEYQYGTNPNVSEGFAVWVSTPNGTTSIP